jgi:hypothetical protein
MLNMAELAPGAAAPAVDQTPPGADPVQAPDTPAVGNEATPPEGDKPVQPPKTFSEEEMRKTVSERLAKERRRMERTLRAEIERDSLRRQLEARDRPQERPQAQGEPRQQDFTDYEEYLLAKAEWRLEQKHRNVREQETQRSRHEQQQRVMVEQSNLAREKVDAAIEKYPDFEDVVLGMSADTLTDPMVAFVLQSKHGIDVGYYLGKHPGEAKKIANLNSVEQMEELVSIASKLAAAARPSNAPPPIRPGGNESASAGFDPDKLSPDAWRKWRDGELRKKR